MSQLQPNSQSQDQTEVDEKIKSIIEEYDAEIDIYIKFVKDAQKEIMELSDLIEEGYILPQRVNRCIVYYNRTLNTLIQEEERYLTKKRTLERAYRSWWDKVFLSARDKLNEGRSSSKFASLTEIQTQTRGDNREEFDKWEKAIEEMDDKVRFYKKLIDSWKKEDMLLNTLSSNLRTEMQKLYVGNITDKNIKSQGGSRVSKRIPV